MPSSFTIRPARLTDLDTLVELEQRCFKGERLSPARFKHWISAENGLLLVAVAKMEGRAVLGYSLSLWRRVGTSARLYSIAIAPEARGQGLAKELLAASTRRLKKLGRTRYTLEVAKRNTAAIALYQKLGFVQFGVYRAYYHDGQDALRMQKAL